MADTTRLFVVCGLPGAGKTTVSAAVAERIDAPLLRTDVVRKEEFPEPDYTDEETAAVYDELLDRAGDALGRDGVAVLDGTFRRADLRDRTRDVADAHGASVVLVKVECDEAVARDRIAAREGDESDADADVYELLRAEFEPVAGDHAVVDNSGSLAETRGQIDELLRRVDAAAPVDEPA
ncbi:AAA family ATPase [Halobaculum sp. P14]|uniref:AAA family ATPase n=1 Tax=Halobaculum sp. P14 TaxID=3421638 RepID=UPI003EB71DAB